MSTKLLGKRPNIKKSVTIIHSQTTETVRLPPDGDTGQVTVHPAVRSKLPLRSKVREAKLQNKKRRRDPKNNNNNSPKKQKTLLKKKKKRVSAAVSAEEAQGKTNEAMIEVPPSKVKKSPQHVVNNKKKKKKKEVIDYSLGVDGENNEGKSNILAVADTDPFGKVQNWLLRSHSALPKSKSTPAGFVTREHQHKVRTARVEKTKTVSVGNLSSEKDKVRLQVIYKPPFKFSLKLRKPDKSVVVDPKTSIQKAKQRKQQRTGVIVKKVQKRERNSKDTVNKKRSRNNDVTSPQSSKQQTPTTSKSFPNVAFSNVTGIDIKNTDNEIDSNIHTVQSDLEVLLSESEFLFSDN